MKPSTRVFNFLHNCDRSLKLTDAADLLERLVIDAENDVLSLAAIEIENNHFPRFTQSEAAYTIRRLAQDLKR